MQKIDTCGSLLYELGKKNVQTQTEIALPMVYESIKVDIGYRSDLLVEDKVIVEVKSVDPLLDIV